MAIKAKCGNCTASFKAKEALAGKRVKCPKCGEQMRIPSVSATPAKTVSKAAAQPARQPAATTRPPASFAGAAGAAHNPLLDLLDEAGVESMPVGPVCENCGSEMLPSAIICVQCGFNMESGQMLVTDSYGTAASPQDDLTDGEKLLAQAEQDIDENPISAIGQDFGDGADSMLIAAGALVVMLVLVGIGIGVIFLMDQISESINSAKISFWASVGIYLLCAIWITIVAIMTKPIQGIACAATAGLYCLIFGFMQGKTLLLPTMILLASVIIGLVSSFFAFDSGGNPYLPN